MGKKTGRLSVRFTLEDMEAIDNISKEEEMWASSWIRKIVLKELVRRGIKKESELDVREYTRWSPRYEYEYEDE